MDDLLTALRAQWDRVLGFGLLAIGVLGVFLGYRGVSHSPYVAEQLAFIISGGIGGLVLVGIGCTVLVTADIRDEWRKLDRIDESLAILATAHRAATAEADEVEEPEPGPDDAALTVADVVVPRDGPVHASALATRRWVSVGGAGVAVAVVLVSIGWRLAANTTEARAAIDATALAVSGVVACGATFVAAIVAMRRTASDRMVRMLDPFHVASLRLAAAAPVATRGDLVTAPGLSHFHRPECAAVAGLTTTAYRPGRASARRACELCLGDAAG